MVDQPEKMWCRSCPAADEIRALLHEAQNKHVSPMAMQMLRWLAGMTPLHRLMHNLNVLIAMCDHHEVRDILNHGLAPDERATLIELDSCGLPVAMREVAHGLFNVHERWSTLKAIAKPVREALAFADERVVEKPLDGVLGETRKDHTNVEG